MLKTSFGGKRKSRLPKNRSQEFGFPEANHTDLKKTDLSETEYQSIYRSNADQIDTIEYRKQTIKDKLDYDILCTRYDQDRIDEIVELLLEIHTSSKSTFRIAGQNVPADLVKEHIAKLDSSHIEYVFECMDKNTTKIRNIKSYLLTTLYNAPLTISHYYQAEVNHDLYGDSPE